MIYRTVVVDPPWHYEAMLRKTGSSFAEAPEDADRAAPLLYPTMTVAEIAALPVRELAGKDAHLYLWTTNRYLPDAFGIVSAWGFKYAQTLVWAKAPMGIGSGGAFTNTAEYVLFGRRGAPGQRRRVDSTWFPWARCKPHSRKPEGFYDLVTTVSRGPYLEMFARRERQGWDAWGDEVLLPVDLYLPVDLSGGAPSY